MARTGRPKGPGDEFQCSGTNDDGKRCTNMVWRTLREQLKSSTDRYFCWEHGHQIGRSKTGVWVECAYPGCDHDHNPKYRKPSEAHFKGCCKSHGAKIRELEEADSKPRINCEYCGELFVPKNPQQRFHSKECASASRRGTGTFICVHCGKVGIKKANNAGKYCDNTCRSEHGHVEVQCVGITEELEPCLVVFKTEKANPRKYHDEACLKRAISARGANPLGEWCNGKPVKVVNGYAQVWAPDHPEANSTGWAQRNRYIYSNHYLDGGPIPAGMQVDHIDRNPLNDDPNNLRLKDFNTHPRDTMIELQRRAREYDSVLSELEQYKQRYGDLPEEEAI